VRESLGGDLQVRIPAKTEPQLQRQALRVVALRAGYWNRKTMDLNPEGSKRRLDQDFVVAQHSPYRAS